MAVFNEILFIFFMKIHCLKFYYALPTLAQVDMVLSA
jgi:hypothetical protein